jgi:hypothetical protein
LFGSIEKNLIEIERIDLKIKELLRSAEVREKVVH